MAEKLQGSQLSKWGCSKVQSSKTINTTAQGKFTISVTAVCVQDILGGTTYLCAQQ